MTEPLKRRNLFSVTPPSPLPEEAIAVVAERNGFQAAGPHPAAASAPVADSDLGSRRRQRHPTGRDHQFNVRLRQETLDFIYGEANGRNVPIAQVIEEMAEALKRERC